MLKLFLISVILVSFFISALPVHAESIFTKIYENLGIFTAEAQLPGGTGISVFSIVIGIINVILTFLGLLFIIMILYGGFTYLTAAGSPDKAKKAIGVIRDSVIGAVIVILSGVFINYVLVKIFEVIQQ